jgi:hypothetical protein
LVVCAQRLRIFGDPAAGQELPQALIFPGSGRKPTSASVGRRRRRHIAQELIAAVTLGRGQVVRNQPARLFDCDLDTVL